MISRLRPRDIAISFQERMYRLGESIDLRIELTPRRDCRVREGRIDLVVEERWIERYTLSVEKPILQSVVGADGPGYVRQIGTTTETREIARDHEETSVHSSVVFLEGVRLVSGRPARYSVRLEIRPEPPRHTGEATMKWQLHTTIDVAGARDIELRSRVSIAA